jgi:hypothetical protein
MKTYQLQVYDIYKKCWPKQAIRADYVVRVEPNYDGYGSENSIFVSLSVYPHRIKVFKSTVCDDFRKDWKIDSLY